MSDSDSVAADGAPVAPPVQRRQRRQPDRFKGPLRIYLIVACADGLCHNFRGEVPNAWAEAGAQGLVVGLALVAAWSLVSSDFGTWRSGIQELRQEAMRGSERGSAKVGSSTQRGPSQPSCIQLPPKGS